METRSVELNICMTCNWSCPSCNRFCDIFRDTAVDTIMTVDEVRGVLDEINKELEVRTFTIIGGEPTVHPECEAICRLVCERMAHSSKRIEVATNNSRPEVVARLRDIQGLSIRVDDAAGRAHKCEKHFNVYDTSCIRNGVFVDRSGCEYGKCGIAIFKHRGRIRWFQCSHAQFLSRVLDVEDKVSAYSLHDLLTREWPGLYEPLCRNCYQQPEFLRAAPRNFGVVADAFRTGYIKVLKEAIASRDIVNPRVHDHSVSSHRTAYVYVTDGNPVEERYRRHSIATLVANVPGASIFTLTGGVNAIADHAAGCGSIIHVDALFAEVYGQGRIDGRSGNGVLPAIVFARLLCPLIPELAGFDRFVYIDSDTEVVSPLFSALEYIPVKALVSGVVDVSRQWAVDGCRQVREHTGIDISPDSYINTGVLLMQRTSDLDSWVSLCRHAFDLDARHAFQSADQEAVNALFSPGLLPGAFNYQCGHPVHRPCDVFLCHYSGEFKHAYLDEATASSALCLGEQREICGTHEMVDALPGSTVIQPDSPFYGYVDHVVVQTCTRYPQRSVLIDAELRRVGITRYLTMVQPDSPVPGHILHGVAHGDGVDRRNVANIWFAHYRAMRVCHDRAYSRVLFVEDDTLFVRDLGVLRRALAELPDTYSVASLDPVVLDEACHTAAVKNGVAHGMHHWALVNDGTGGPWLRGAGCRLLSREAIAAYVTLHEAVFSGEGMAHTADTQYGDVVGVTGKPLLYAVPNLSVNGPLEGMVDEHGEFTSFVQKHYQSRGIDVSEYGGDPVTTAVAPVVVADSGVGCAAQMSDRSSSDPLFRLLTPYDIPGLSKLRLGAEHDGGYVVASELLGSIDHIVSSEFGGDTSLERDIMLLNNRCDLVNYDDRAEEARIDARSVCKRASVGVDKPVASMIAGLDNVLLKLDVEGREFDAFHLRVNKFPDLSRLVMLVIELHSIVGDNYTQTVGLLSNIEKQMTLFHVHANDFGGYTDFRGHRVPNVVELTFVANRFASGAVPSSSKYPVPGVDVCLRPGGEDIPLTFIQPME